MKKYKYLPTIEEIRNQYMALAEDIVNVSTIEEVLKLKSRFEIEINGDNLECYNGEPIETIRYEADHILVYADIENGKVKVVEDFSLYDNEGNYLGEVTINTLEDDLKELEENGFIEIVEEKYKVVLYHVELEDGLTKEQIITLLNSLEEDDRGYMPIEFHSNNSSAYGFVCSSYYEELSYESDMISKAIIPVLSDWSNEKDDCVYTLADETKIQMLCDYKTI